MCPSLFASWPCHKKYASANKAVETYKKNHLVIAHESSAIFRRAAVLGLEAFQVLSHSLLGPKAALCPQPLVSFSGLADTMEMTT